LNRQRKPDISNNVGSVKSFLDRLLHSLRRVFSFVIFLWPLVDNHGSSVIFRSVSVRPTHLFDPISDHDYSFKLPLREGAGRPGGFSDDAILMLQTYSYPGNVRELENVIERAILMARGRVVMPSHFPTKSAPENGRNSTQLQTDLLSLPFHRPIAELEKQLIENALNKAKGNKTEAADRLQINRRLLYNKMEKHKIKEKD
jgi:hypothetical protein